MTSADDERAILRVVQDLFILTDRKGWAGVRILFEDGPVDVDMTSLDGGDPVAMTADVLIAGFTVGLHPGKQSHHMTTNHHVVVADEAAVVTLHGYVWNKLVDRADLWETWGTYTIGLSRRGDSWKITSFRYDAKANRGDDRIRTHTDGS